MSTKGQTKSAAKSALKSTPSAASKAEAKADAKAEGSAAAEEISAEPLALPLPAWVRRVTALAAIAIGWGFIAWHNRYITPASVILALGWAASISTLYFLWRVGAAGNDSSATREDWWLAVGQQEELEREKRALLKTIREIEFDQQTGKLSPHDAQEMTQVVRVRAIEVMKALDAVEQGGGARAEIEREVRARLEIEKARKAGAAAKKGKAGVAAKPMPKAEAAGAKPGAAKAGAKTGSTTASATSEAGAEDAADASDVNDDVKPSAKAESARSATAINAAPALSDDLSDAPAPREPEEANGSGDSSEASASSGSDDEPGDGVAVSTATPSSGPKSSEVSA